VARGEAILYELLSLGGGQVDGIPPEHIQDHECEMIENFIPIGTRLRARNGIYGTTRVTATPYGENVTSLFPFKLSTGMWLLLAGTVTGLAKLDGDALVALPVSDGQVYASSASPWHFRQYKNEVLAVRRATGTMKRVTRDNVMDAGIPAPSVAPTIADGGPGNLDAGDFVPVFTFYVQATAAESNPSPAGATLTQGANRQLAWGNIGVSLNGQVDARRLYRTLPSQPGEYYFVAQINDNFTTTYTDNVIVANQGRQVSFDNGLPPPGIDLLEIWRERAWVSDGTEVYYSNIHAGISNVQGFGEFNHFPVTPDDGHRIVVLHAHGAQLIIGKTNAVHYVIPAGGGFSREVLSDKHGCIAPFSMKTAERLLFWYSGDNVYRSDGVNVVSISTIKIRKKLDLIPETMKDKVVAAVLPELSLYILTVSQGSLTQNEAMLVYNYKTDVWTTSRLPDATCPAFIGDFFDTNQAQVLYAALYDGHVYQLFSGADDFGTPILAIVRGKGLGLDRPTFRKGVRRLSLLCDTVPETVTVRMYRDLNFATADRTVSLDQNTEWKRFSLSTMGLLGLTLQWEVEYEGRSPLELSGVVLEAVGFRRMGKVL
jgi:hypothetical protein